MTVEEARIKINLMWLRARIAELRDEQSKADTRLIMIDMRRLMLELRYNENHDPHTGRFTSGDGVDISGESSIIEPSATGANKLRVKGFRNKQAMNNHKKHISEYKNDGIFTAEQYEKRAVELLEMPAGGNISGHLDKNNHVIRYDKAKNDFVKGDISKGVMTMFKPEDGYSYYLVQRTEDIKHGGKA